jgi:predicted PurR-regulated permease PerM
MEPLGINFGLLLVQIIMVIVFIGFPMLSLFDLAKKRLSGTPLALWAFIICLVPLIGSLAYWIIKPTHKEV